MDVEEALPQVFPLAEGLYGQHGHARRAEVLGLHRGPERARLHNLLAREPKLVDRRDLPSLGNLAHLCRPEARVSTRQTAYKEVTHHRLLDGPKLVDDGLSGLDGIVTRRKAVGDLP